jgi:hypothetical protein
MIEAKPRENTSIILNLALVFGFLNKKTKGIRRGF